MNDLLVKQCTTLIEQALEQNIHQFRSYLNNLKTVDISFLGTTCSHYGIKFNVIATYMYKLELAKATDSEESLRVLLALLKKEVHQPSRN